MKKELKKLLRKQLKKQSRKGKGNGSSEKVGVFSKHSFLNLQTILQVLTPGDPVLIG